MLLVAAVWMIAASMSAQEHYRFACRDYVATDDARARQSAFSYDLEANTFSIAASGANNVAFKMNEGMDGEYYIDNDETMLLICGENLQTTQTASYVWWLNGFNNFGQTPADQRLSDGTDAVLLWNLKTNSAVNGNFDWTKEKISISAFGNSFILAVGLTAKDAAKPGVVKDFGYYAPWEVAAKHPSLMTSLGYTGRTLTRACKAKTLKLDATRQADADAIADDDYAAAYALYLDVRQKKSEDGGEHTGSYAKIQRGITARFDDQFIRIQFVNDSTVRICKGMTSADLNHESWAVIASADNATDVTVTDLDENNVVLQTPKMRIEYHLKKGTADFFRADGTPLLSEARHRFTDTMDGPFASYTINQYFRLADDERIYGMGQIQDGQLNRRGTSVMLEQENRRISIPYFLSSKNYGLYWDNYSPTNFNDVGPETQFRSTGRCIDYYVLCADNSHEVQRSLRNLTGNTELPPLWNFGLYQSKERYASANEVMNVVKQYRDLNVPLDCIVQDWQYWGSNDYWNAMEFLNPDYSNYQEMIDFVHANNAKLMISIWANFGPQTKQFATLRDKGLLFTSDTWPPGAGVKPYNPYSAEARDIYWDYLWKGLFCHNIDAYWMDSTEPDFFGGEGDKDNVALPGQTWRSLRNAFPLATVQGVAQHHRAQPELSDKRVSIMTRSGYIGMQRTGAYVWSADIDGNWETLAKQIPAACNLSECGLPYWNSDTGGFFVNNNDQWHRLYTRWTQFSTFTPMLRFHGTSTPREIWQFGAQGDSKGEFDNLLRYIKIRYSLLPYLYSTANKVRTDAQGFMQAMPIAFPQDEQTFGIADQYMFGRSFLVAPIVTDGVIGRDVYLPTGERWMDFWTGYTFEGGQKVFKTAPADIMPLYVRAGSILPWGPEVQYSSEKNWDNLELRLYPGQDGEFTLYEDELDGYNYEKGQSAEIPMTWNEATKTLTIGARRGSFPGMLAERTFNIVVVTPENGFGDAHATKFDATIHYTGEEVSIQLDVKNVQEPTLEEVLDKIVNPSFEADGSALTKVAPQGWEVSSSTFWWGVNQVGAGATGDPQPTDGQYIFGVWDGEVMEASISQTLSNLDAGNYRLTVDMHCSNRPWANRLGDQCVFAGDARGYFRDQVSTPGSDDAVPMQTIHVDFTVKADNDPVTIGVSTANAPNETWFKIDNFRLYRLEQDETTGIGEVKSEEQKVKNEGAIYDLQGRRVGHASKGLYIVGGKKVLST